MMLARTGSSLFWTGRYIERIEHLARYLNAQYLSFADAPRALDKNLGLESMLSMADAKDDFTAKHESYDEESVIHFLTLDEQNPYSIRNYLSTIRENSRGIRDHLSTELWETINRFYHSANEFTEEDLSRKGPYDFCKHVLNHVNIIKGVADNTVLRNESWSMIRVGINLERTIQITQILITKLEDISKIDYEKLSPAISGYHWASLLRGAGGFDMSRHYYHEAPNRERGIEFLILNQKFPKSVLFNLKELQTHLLNISLNNSTSPETVEFTTGKLIAYMEYLTIDDIMQEGEIFLYKLQEHLFKIGNELEQQYLQY